MRRSDRRVRDCGVLRRERRLAIDKRKATFGFHDDEYPFLHDSLPLFTARVALSVRTVVVLRSTAS